MVLNRVVVIVSGGGKGGALTSNRPHLVDAPSQPYRCLLLPPIMAQPETEQKTNYYNIKIARGCLGVIGTAKPGLKIKVLSREPNCIF